MNYKRKLIPPVRRVPGTMNGQESKYAHLLENRKRAGEILDWGYESMRFKLAPGSIYTPDFFVVYEDHMELIEIKGFLREAAGVRFKVAVEKYPWFKWTMLRWKNKRWETVMGDEIT